MPKVFFLGFNDSFRHQDGLYFGLFLSVWSIFSLHKKINSEDCLQAFLTFGVILDKYAISTSSKKIWVKTNSKHATNITWWVYWMCNKCLILHIFFTFKIPLLPIVHWQHMRFSWCQHTRCDWVHQVTGGRALLCTSAWSNCSTTTFLVCSLWLSCHVEGLDVWKLLLKILLKQNKHQ